VSVCARARVHAARLSLRLFFSFFPLIIARLRDCSRSVFERCIKIIRGRYHAADITSQTSGRLCNKCAIGGFATELGRMEIRKKFLWLSPPERRFFKTRPRLLGATETTPLAIIDRQGIRYRSIYRTALETAPRSICRRCILRQ